MKWTLFALLFSLSATAFDPSSIKTRRDIEVTSVKYFIDHSHPETGLVRDKAQNFASTSQNNVMASLAATGFGMTVIAHASTRGYVTRDYAVAYVQKVLRSTWDLVPHYRGWLTHFAHWETGVSLPDSEISTIDTALFVAGALYAAQVLKDPIIQDLSYRFHQRMDFSSPLTDDGAHPNKKTLSLSYTPEKGWTSYQWNIYAEQKILLLLGLGHPTKPLSRDTWYAWSRVLMGIHMPLFIHQYSPVFFDFRNFNDGRKNYFKAGLDASFLHRNQRQIFSSKTYQAGFWGLSAGEDSTGYRVYQPGNFNGTVCVGCALGSAMFMPEVLMADAKLWKTGRFASRVWGKYGFVDSVNLDQNWVSSYVLGITVGPQYMSLNNMEGRTSIWKDFMKVPAMKRAITRIMKGRK